MDKKVETVLIVEDDTSYQFFMKALFNKNFPEIKLSQAYDGQEALTFFEDESPIPDLVLLDLNMAGANGFDFLDAVKSKYDKAPTRIVVVTSSDSDFDKQRVESYGIVEDFYTKVMTKEDIEELV